MADDDNVARVARGLYWRDEAAPWPDMPNGKLRGILPYVHRLRLHGATGLVNAGASHSNSHALAAYAGHVAKLPVVTLVNTGRTMPGTDLAASWGAQVQLAGPSHLAPLRARARAVAQGMGYEMLPWGFASLGVVGSLACTVEDVPDEFDWYVVAVGAGGYAAALAVGAHRYGKRARVLAVGAMPRGNTEDHVRVLMTDGAPADRLVYMPGGTAEATPFPADPHYEHVAWPFALDLASRPGARVLFWSVGGPLTGARP